jgi:hypothetical protein
MKNNIPTREYLEYSLQLTNTELQIRDEMMSWLPDIIIDCHAHCNPASLVGELDNGVRSHMMSTFPDFSLEDSKRVQAVLYPNKVVRTLRFANAYRGIDHRTANGYLLSRASELDGVALYGLPDEAEYTIGMLDHGKVQGLKMYYQYFNPPATTIREVFPPEILAAAQTQGVPIILHLPKMITQSVDDLCSVLEEFPRLVVVLAHLGLPHLPVPGLMAAYQRVAAYPNVFMDTSMIPSAEVTFMALQAFGPGRIMFGSDEPLSLIRSTVYNHPTKGQRLITEYPYHWVDPAEHAEYRHLAKDVTQTHWQVLQAIQQAVFQLPANLQTRAVEAIFYTNARMVFGF